LNLSPINGILDDRWFERKDGKEWLARTPARKSHFGAFCTFSRKDASSLEESIATAVTRP
jgi:hypothetical protein